MGPLPPLQVPVQTDLVPQRLGVCPLLLPPVLKRASFPKLSRTCGEEASTTQPIFSERQTAVGAVKISISFKGRGF